MPLAVKPPPGSPTTKFKGMSKAWEFHFRFMHSESIFGEVKSKIFDSIGMF